MWMGVGVALPFIVCGDDGRGSCGRPWGAFVQFVWHLSLSVVAAREHLWRSSLRGVGGDSGVSHGRHCILQQGWDGGTQVRDGVGF